MKKHHSGSISHSYRFTGFLSIFIIAGLLACACIDPSNPSTNETGSGLSLSPKTCAFPDTLVGYEGLGPRTIQVQNNRNSAIKAAVSLGGPQAGSFRLSAKSLSIPANDARPFTVVPIAGLAEGKHAATITVSAKGCESQVLTVNFTVITAIKEEIHVYLAFGQSNMQGPGEVRVKDKANVSERWKVLNVVAGIYAQENRANSQWYRAVPPLIIPDSGSPNYLGIPIGLGPSDYFGRTLVSGTPEHITIGVIAVANGDLALASFHKTQGAAYFSSGSTGKEANRPSSTETQGWNRYTGAGYASIYDAIVSNAKLAQEQGGIIKGIIVHQGESGRGLTYAPWHQILKEIYDDMLADLGLQPNSIPILLGQLWNAGTGPGGYLNTDNTLIQQIIPNAWIISSAGLTQGRTGQGQPDNTHFGAADLEGLGIRYAEKMLELVY